MPIRWVGGEETSFQRPRRGRDGGSGYQTRQKLREEEDGGPTTGEDHNVRGIQNLGVPPDKGGKRAGLRLN